MPTYATNERFTLYQGDNRIVLKELADNSVDSIVTDPPYELGFMGKKWDASGIAFNVEVWQECLRVLKPGGHLLAFSGSRTYHRMAVAIEDAGFDIRDQIMWIYGSGFPKSLDVSKAIDKAAGAEREVVGERKQRANSSNSLVPMNASIDEVEYITAPATTEAKQWQGWGTALKPAHEPIVVARKPLIGTVAENVLTYGTGGLNIDGGRVGSEGGTKLADEDVEESSASKTVIAYGNGLGGPFGKPIQGLGRWPANVIHDGSDEVVGLFPQTTSGNLDQASVKAVDKIYGGGFGNGKTNPRKFAANFGTAARFFYCAKASKKDRNEGLDIDEFPLKHYTTANKMGGENDTMLTGSGNPRDSRKQNHHPTVKPTTLMQYLCKLVTPPGGIVLDPFMGSGSTGKAAMYEGFNFIGIEMTDEYLPIAKARIEYAKGEEDAHLPIHL